MATLNTQQTKPLLPATEQLSFDLDNYFQKIGYTGDVRHNLDTLQMLHQLHPQKLPFENLNPYLGIPVKLDIVSLYHKMVLEKRGGYCFEHNLLFAHVLKTLGFKVKTLAARVMWNVPDGLVTPRSHMLLCVEVDEELYIADVGFGGMTLTTPLKLTPTLEQATTHESFRLIEAEPYFILQGKVKNEWKAIYRFTLEEQYQPDYEVMSWYLSNYPASHFVTGLIAARVTTYGRLALRNNELAIHHLNSETERKQIKTVDELKMILTTEFGIDIPEVIDLESKLQQLIPLG